MADAGGSRVCGKTVLEEEEGGERRRGVLGGRMKTSLQRLDGLRPRLWTLHGLECRVLCCVTEDGTTESFSLSWEYFIPLSGRVVKMRTLH